MQGQQDFLLNQADEYVKMAWVNFVTRTDKLNTMEGCETLIPLPKILSIDKQHVIELMNRMEIPPENRLIHEDEESDVE